MLAREFLVGIPNLSKTSNDLANHTAKQAMHRISSWLPCMHGACVFFLCPDEFVPSQSV
jgi:hypothetical protein